MPPMHPGGALLLLTDKEGVFYFSLNYTLSLFQTLVLCLLPLHQHPQLRWKLSADKTDEDFCTRLFSAYHISDLFSVTIEWWQFPLILYLGQFLWWFCTFFLMTLNCCQIITLNSHFGSFTLFNDFMRIFIWIHFPWKLPDCTIKYRTVLIILGSRFW